MTKREFIKKHNTFELICVDKEDSGLNSDLYLLSSGKNKRNLSPLIYVCFNNEIVTFSIEDIDLKPAEPTNLTSGLIGEISKYIKSNHKLLIKHWNNEITDKIVLNRLNIK